MLNAQRTERLAGGEMIALNLCVLSRSCVVNAVFGGCVEREIAGVAEDEEPMLTRKGGSEWVEC